MAWNKCKEMNLSKIGSIAGAFFMLLPGRPILYWGNMSVYVLSYIIIRRNPDVGIQPVWLSSMYAICWTVGMVVSGCISNIIGKRVALIIGMIVFNLCVFLSYFTIQVSTTTFILIYGSFTGLGNGFVEGLLFKCYVVPWSTNDTGCLTSIVVSGAEFGAVVMDQFVTLYVNPDNLSTDTSRGNLKLFSQANILDNVSSLFFVQGIVSSLLQIIGFCLIREKKVSNTSSDSSTGRSSLAPEESETNQILTSKNSGDASCTRNGRSGLDSMSSIDMVKSPMFYFLWIAYFSSTTSRTILNTYYKIYGQTRIHDDYFLTNLGTTMTLLAAIITLVWGVVVDRIGLKTVHITIQAVLSLTNIFLYFAISGSWIYFVNCCLLTSATAPLYMCFTVTIVMMFGRNELNVKMAIASTAPLASSFAAGPISEAILPNLGWFALFMWPGFLAISSLILIICTFPDI